MALIYADKRDINSGSWTLLSGFDKTAANIEGPYMRVGEQ